MSNAKIALVAFIGHHPGVRLLFGLRQTPWARTVNVVALALALLLAAIAGWAAGAVWGLGVFVVGHFAWSTAYAAMIVQLPRRDIFDAQLTSPR